MARTDFHLKQRLNMFVLQELADAKRVDPNDVAVSILNSPVHRYVGELAEAMTKEIDLHR